MRETSKGHEGLPLDLVLRAKAGDLEARETLVRRYRPFVVSQAAKVAGRFVNEGSDDEYSVALIAFNEAIDAYDPARGVAFLTFSETVIRRRLIDFFRKEKSRREIPLSSYDREDEEGSVQNPVDLDMSVGAWDGARAAEDRRLEIQAYTEALRAYGLSLPELVEATPKHEDARRMAQDVARTLVSRPELLRFVEEQKRLPLKELSEIVRVSRKTLERQRKYILAVALAMTGEFHYLRGYFQ